MKKMIHKLLYKLFTPIVNKLSKLENQIYHLSELKNNVEENRILFAKSLINDIRELKIYPSKLSDIEFKVFSQWGEDGIIQFLISKVPIQNKIFVEFGVENYLESNTRFLLMNNNWSGLILDGDENNIQSIRGKKFYWRYDLKSEAVFITKDNINSVIKASGIAGDIGLLSIDIDGNDYWVWDSIDVISPRIIICEYNSIFGFEEAVTIPYDKDFNTTEAHFSNLYFGASLKALCILAEKKGYVFVGCSSAGANAFFVRRDVASGVKPVSCKDGYAESKFRESRDVHGRLTFTSGVNRIKVIENMPVVDIISGEEKLIKDLLL
ncbi:MAG: hypothetical protein K9J12_03165 [Melioribacteraceae bacterium]|nr:hypothetical protein [Melioribacteraceae bacterium]MCF8265775.1 hypothetical protein [Melioribacteraceae bacterium]MCF8431848.1 hypothetical protein [Melioribacteraceae bacterium]